MPEKAHMHTYTRAHASRRNAARHITPHGTTTMGGGGNGRGCGNGLGQDMTTAQHSTAQHGRIMQWHQGLLSAQSPKEKISAGLGSPDIAFSGHL
eukprot:9868723-Lingulodinium_polyedra.AAC.1